MIYADKKGKGLLDAGIPIEVGEGKRCKRKNVRGRWDLRGQRD